MKCIFKSNSRKNKEKQNRYKSAFLNQFNISFLSLVTEYFSQMMKINIGRTRINLTATVCNLTYLSNVIKPSKRIVTIIKMVQFLSYCNVYCSSFRASRRMRQRSQKVFIGVNIQFRSAMNATISEIKKRKILFILFLQKLFLKKAIKY